MKKSKLLALKTQLLALLNKPETIKRNQQIAILKARIAQIEHPPVMSEADKAQQQKRREQRAARKENQARVAAAEKVRKARETVETKRRIKADSIERMNQIIGNYEDLPWADNSRSEVDSSIPRPLSPAKQIGRSTQAEHREVWEHHGLTKIEWSEFVAFTRARGLENVSLVKRVQMFKDNAEMAEPAAQHGVSFENSYADSQKAADRSESVISNPESVEPVSVIAHKETRTITTRNQTEQADFRARVMARFDGRCAITGCKMGIDAHHIVALVEGGDHSTDNGIALRRDIHTYVHSGHARLIDGIIVFSLELLEDRPDLIQYNGKAWRK